MRWVYGLVMAGALVLAAGSSAQAQDSMNAFGSYPAGITTGSAYGFYPGGYRQTYTTYRTPSGYVTMPRVTYYSSGYYGGTAGATTYGPAVNYSSPNAAAYGYGAAAPTYPSYGYTSPYGYTSTYRVRRGLFGPRAVMTAPSYR